MIVAWDASVCRCDEGQLFDTARHDHIPSTPFHRSISRPTIHELISTATEDPLQLPSAPDLGRTRGVPRSNERNKGMLRVYQISPSLPRVVPRCCPTAPGAFACCWRVCERSLCQQVSASWNMGQRKHCEAPTSYHSHDVLLLLGRPCACQPQPFG